MKLQLVLILLLSLYSQNDTAKTYGWKNDVVSTINYTNTSFDNWAAGGEDAYTWQFNALARFVEDQKKYTWSNTVEFSYGKTKVGDQEAKKTTDELKLESVYTYKIGTAINPYLAATGQTQLTKSYSYKDDVKTEISDYMDPAYFTQSIGVGYAKGEQIKTRLGFSVKETIATKFTNFSDDPKTTKIEKTRVNYGAESVTDLNQMISEKIRYTSKLSIFSNFEGIKYVDVNWDNMFSAKVSDFISVSFNYKLTYDHNISVKRQIKKVLAAGFTYSFL